MTDANLQTAVIVLGRKCTVSVSGFPEGGDYITTPEEALKAIKLALKMGLNSTRDLNRYLCGEYKS